MSHFPTFWAAFLLLESLSDRAGNSLISLKSTEQLWEIRSERSRQMSDRERIAQVAQLSWAIMSDSLRSLRGNELCEWITHFAHKKWANERFAKKILANKSKILFYYVLRKALKKNSKKWANRSFAHYLTKNERNNWKIRKNERIAHLLIIWQKNDRNNWNFN